MSREFVALAVMGIDQHENGVVAVARVLREAQMRVEYFGTLQTPVSVAERAIDCAADVIGISCHFWEYLTLVPALLDELRRRAADIPVILGGSVITPDDARAMQAAGVAAVFPSAMEGERVIDCVRSLGARRRGRRGAGGDREVQSPG